MAVVAAHAQSAEPAKGGHIVATAQAANRWTDGRTEIWILRGQARIKQGGRTVQGREAVLWIDPDHSDGQAGQQAVAYLEGDVRVEDQGIAAPGGTGEQVWLGRFVTGGSVKVQVPQIAGQPSPIPPIYQRGIARRRPIPDGAIRRTQHTVMQGGDAPSPDAVPQGNRRIRMFSRSSVPIQAEWFTDPATGQSTAVITSGVNLIVDGLEGYGSIDVATDRLVIWTVDILDAGGSGGGSFQPENLPLEIYMEGNIVFRQGDRVIYADRMYYDVTSRIGMVLDAELLTPVEDYEGLLRLRADILQQISEDRFVARNTWVTSSRLGRPGYRIQSGTVFFEDRQNPVFDPFTGAQVIDPETGEPLVRHQRLATARDNLLFLREVPVFYYPYLATDLTQPTYYIRRARLRNDNVFGTQILTDWDTYQLLGIQNKPAGTDWMTTLDYLSDRGFGHGTTFTYNRGDFLGVGGRAVGLLDYWGIQDHGEDNLGRGRRAIPPDKDYRWRLLWRHRQHLAGDIRLTGEVGWISDRNFLEQYFEKEWDELKDQTTGLELKQTRDNWSWSITADARLNKFFTQTEWLPRADHFWLGQPLLGDVFTWYEHSSIGYGRFRTASAPTDPADLAAFSYLAWEQDGLVPGDPLSAAGERIATRQEIDWPFQLGPVKLVPYGLGELAHWGEDRYGDDLQRAYWQAGVRASVPLWRAYPWIESELLNVHGVAHKVTFDAEFSFADSNRDMADLPLYDPLDDDSIEAFRRRFSVNTFGGAIPPMFDERYYALRTGMGGWVTAPSTEIADDLMAVRLGMRHRWQTKRGMPGDRRIIDWITFDTNLTLFPDELRDNFGRTVGLVDYDARWHVGDRLTLISTGAFDFFTDGQQLITMGSFLSRPPRGSLYLGMHLLDGPIDATILSVSYTYRMSPKWVSSFGASWDLGNENIGERFTVTRIGESFLISAGLHVDHSRDNVGFNLAIEPRFLPKTRLGRTAGARIPPAGLYGLE